MPSPATRQLLRRHAIAFAVSSGFATALLLANYMAKRLPDLRASGAPAGAILAGMLLAVPFTVAITIPLGIFIAVLWVFTRLGAEGVLTAARRERHGVRRLVAPVIGASAVVGALLLVWNTQILPRANERLSLLHGGAAERNGREMLISELRAAARSARTDAGPDALARAASYEVEIHKKYALAAACVVLALTGAAFGLLFPGGGTALVIGSAYLIFAVYYVGLIAGESIADRLLISPFVAMWMANALLLAFALPVLWWSGRTNAPRGTGSLPIEASLDVDHVEGGPLPLRVVAVLCALTGLFGLVGTIAASLALGPTAPRIWILFGVNAIAELVTCLAAVWVWKRLRRAFVAVGLAWLLSMVVGLIAGATVTHLGWLLTLALITLVSNRHQLR